MLDTKDIIIRLIVQLFKKANYNWMNIFQNKNFQKQT